LAQNFDQEFPSLENLKKTHFGVITQLLCDEQGSSAISQTE